MSIFEIVKRDLKEKDRKYREKISIENLVDSETLKKTPTMTI
jgi:hypothetical protein